MLVTREYDRSHAFEYARRWAFGRNPLFYNFTGQGGDCTNFISQCVFAGTCIMNFTPVFGWFYLSVNERAASWTGVDFFYNFITGNKGEGPFGKETFPGGLLIGDVIQLRNKEGRYYHTLLVTGFSEDGYLVSAHSDDAFDRPLDTYDYAEARFIHIEGARYETDANFLCFNDLLNGAALDI